MSTPKRAKLGNWNEVKGGRSGEIQRDGRERRARNCRSHELGAQRPSSKS